MSGFLLACAFLWLVLFFVISVWLHYVDRNWGRTRRDGPEVAIVSGLFTVAFAGLALVIAAAIGMVGGTE